MRTLIKSATVVNEGKSFKASIIINDDRIAEIIENDNTPRGEFDETVDATGCFVLPGIIDDHVHFREPGLTAKADIGSESRAAAYGGVFLKSKIEIRQAAVFLRQLLFAIYIVKCCDERRRICADIAVQILDKVLFGIAYHDRRTPFHPISCGIRAFVQPAAGKLQTVFFKFFRHRIRNTVHADFTVCA